MTGLLNVIVPYVWSNDVGEVFSIAGGLKQGSLCSLILFPVYTDILIERLKEKGVRCRINGQ